jgi:hypothetical protein
VGLVDAVGDDARAYSAEALRVFIVDRARPHGTWRAKSIVVTVRSYLRFLAITRRCSTDLKHAIPGFASWQFSSVPRFLAEEVERIIGSCTRYSFALRDRAVLLPLARLELCAGEVASLQFADIDWSKGGSTVCGKRRRQELRPLPQEVGNAILLYLKQGRPSLQAPAVFTMVKAPLRVLSRAALCCLPPSPSAYPQAGVSVWQLIAGAGGIRYWFFPSFAFVWSLPWCYRSLRKGSQIFAAFFLVALCFGVARDWRLPAFQHHHFTEAAKQFASAPTGTAVTFQLNPAG